MIMTYYIVTSSLNIENILSTESISPTIFKLIPVYKGLLSCVDVENTV